MNKTELCSTFNQIARFASSTLKQKNVKASRNDRVITKRVQDWKVLCITLLWKWGTIAGVGGFVLLMPLPVDICLSSSCALSYDIGDQFMPFVPVSRALNKLNP